MKQPSLYILASAPYGTLYVGATSNIARRVWEHRTGAVDGFTKRYRVERLVYCEFHETMPDAITRERQIKKWNRAWKIRLIESENPDWRDLYETILR